MTIQILETERLILQVPQLSDLDNLIALRTDPEVMRCIGGFGQAFGTGVIQDTDEIKHQLSLSQDYFDTYGLGFFCAFEKKTGEFIGQAGLFHHSFNTNQSTIELAYRLQKKHWGQGYATELAIALIDWGLYTYKLPKIISPVHPGNKRSIRVLEKSGMQCEGTICHKGHNIPCYSISRDIPSHDEIVAHNKHAYNIIAKTWNSKRQWYIEKKSIDQTISKIKPHASILDVGCGNGKPIAEYLQSKGFDVYGIDISQNLLNYAKEILGIHHVFCGDLRTITLDKTFDAIVCWFALFHLHESEHDTVLKKMYSLLNEEGILCITFADTSTKPGEGNTFKIDHNVILGIQFGQTFYHSGCPAPQNRQRVIDAGFEIVSDTIDQPGNQVIIARKRLNPAPSRAEKE